LSSFGIRPECGITPRNLLARCDRPHKFIHNTSQLKLMDSLADPPRPLASLGPNGGGGRNRAGTKVWKYGSELGGAGEVIDRLHVLRTPTSPQAQCILSIDLHRSAHAPHRRQARPRRLTGGDAASRQRASLPPERAGIASTMYNSIQFNSISKSHGTMTHHGERALKHLAQQSRAMYSLGLDRLASTGARLTGSDLLGP
jgi:hypothetical protein